MRVGTEDPPPLVEPSRPIAVEAAAAVLLAGGAFRLGAIAVALIGAGAAPPVIPAVALAETLIQVVTILVAFLVRGGRAWVAAVNVVAILAFLALFETLSAPSPLGPLFTILYGFAFVAVFVNKPWFDAKQAVRAARPDVRR
jgi:hypothetical protein